MLVQVARLFTLLKAALPDAGADVMIPNKLPLNSASGSGDAGRSLRRVDQG